MSIATTPAIYKNGVVIPKIKPLFDDPDEVVVTFVKLKEPEATQGNALGSVAILKKYQGLLPKDIDSAQYVSSLREDMSKDWEDKIN